MSFSMTLYQLLRTDTGTTLEEKKSSRHEWKKVHTDVKHNNVYLSLLITSREKQHVFSKYDQFTKACAFGQLTGSRHYAGVYIIWSTT